MQSLKKMKNIDDKKMSQHGSFKAGRAQNWYKTF